MSDTLAFYFLCNIEMRTAVRITRLKFIGYRNHIFRKLSIYDDRKADDS